MYKEVFIKDFSALGESVEGLLLDMSGKTLLNRAFEDSLRVNPLFTINMQREALSAISKKFLNTGSLNRWLSPYGENIFERNKSVGIIMAGNIPLVGFHDYLVTLASGCLAQIKLSGKDKDLLPFLFQTLCEINPFWRERVKFTEELPENTDLLLATGGEQATTLFNSLYKEIPKIVRGSRFSIAILNGDETIDELRGLSNDIFLYYGMGCRSVSTLLMPEAYSFEMLIEAFKTMNTAITSEDYYAAYKYQKALSSMKNEWHIDGGFYLLKELSGLSPPMGVINIMPYKVVNQIDNFISSNEHNLQCLVNRKFRSTNIEFGQTQYPSISEYADGINSLEFILNYV